MRKGLSRGDQDRKEERKEREEGREGGREEGRKEKGKEKKKKERGRGIVSEWTHLSPIILGSSRKVYPGSPRPARPVLSRERLSQAGRRLGQLSQDCCCYVIVLGFFIIGHMWGSTGCGMQNSYRFWPHRPGWRLEW